MRRSTLTVNDLIHSNQNGSYHDSSQSRRLPNLSPDNNAWTTSVGMPYNRNSAQDDQPPYYNRRSRREDDGHINYGYTRSNSTVDESAFVSRSKPWLLGYKRWIGWKWNAIFLMNVPDRSSQAYSMKVQTYKCTNEVKWTEQYNRDDHNDNQIIKMWTMNE